MKIDKNGMKVWEKGEAMKYHTEHFTTTVEKIIEANEKGIFLFPELIQEPVGKYSEMAMKILKEENKWQYRTLSMELNLKQWYKNIEKEAIEFELEYAMQRRLAEQEKGNNPMDWTFMENYQFNLLVEKDTMQEVIEQIIMPKIIVYKKAKA